jgi:hypothetical protein
LSFYETFWHFNFFILGIRIVKLIIKIALCIEDKNAWEMYREWM